MSSRPWSIIYRLFQSLREFLEIIIGGQENGLKVSSVGQCIVQASRPLVMLAPVHIGLGVQLHHHFASRFLIDTL